MQTTGDTVSALGFLSSKECIAKPSANETNKRQTIEKCKRHCKITPITKNLIMPKSLMDLYRSLGKFNTLSRHALLPNSNQQR